MIASQLYLNIIISGREVKRKEAKIDFFFSSMVKEESSKATLLERKNKNRWS